MNEFLQDSVFFGVFISVVTYEIGALIKRKWNVAIFNPLLISIALIIVFLILFDVDYDTYDFGAQYLSYFLTPATVALAVPLYEQIEPLKNNWKAIIAGILSGALTSALCVLILSIVMGLDHKQYASKVDYDRHRNGTFGGTWRYCDDHGCGHCCDWCDRQYVRGTDL